MPLFRKEREVVKDATDVAKRSLSTTLVIAAVAIVIAVLALIVAIVR